MKFRFEHGLIFVPIAIQYENEPGTIPDCIIDTGSAKTTLDSSLVNINYQKPTIFRRLLSIGGYEETIVQEIDWISCGNKNISNMKILFGDLKNKYGINGFIGNDFFEKSRLIVDYINQELQIQ
jgi:hypothetical protein